MNINILIDQRNTDLWKYINKKFKTHVEQHEGSHFYYRIIEEELTLFIPQKNGTVELFTHELLHIYLLIRGINITAYLKERFQNEPLLNWSLTENLFEQVGSQLEHAKIFPLYLKKGFKRELFVENYFMNICSPMSMQIIQSGMSKKVPSSASIDLFINKFFAIKANINPMFDYQPNLQFLEKVNKELHKILDFFWKDWLLFDIRNCSEYKPKIAAFVHELGTWVIENVYVKEIERA